MEFTTPDFLQNSSTDEIQKAMMAILPSDIDVSEGSHAWNLTRAPALVVAETREFILPEVIKLIFPEWSYGDFLDMHAKSRNMSRRAASSASGKLTITGASGTIIQAGSLFSTAAMNNEPSVDYKVLVSKKIPDEGSVSVDIQCTQTGTAGNAQQNTITIVSSNIKGISSVTNDDPVTGGTDIESDESLIQRILEYDQNLGSSYVGNVADYKRWATEVPGVGNAKVIPAHDDTGLVTISITDANGDPATEQLCTSVYNHIMKPDAPDERLAPPNAVLSVEPPETIPISIKATVELSEGATIESVKEEYIAKLAIYLPVALEEGELKYTRIASALASVDGAYDFTGLQFGVKTGDTITYGTSNIEISSNDVPTFSADDLVLTAGTV